MSNRWITWQCIACERHVTIAWIIEPGWPSGLHHRRASLCAACLPLHGAEVFVVDGAVEAQMRGLSESLGERLMRQIPAMEGRPKEKFLALGLSDAAARAAADAWSQLRGALEARNKRARSAAEGHLQQLTTCCLEPTLTLLAPEEAELLRRLHGRTATAQDSAAVPLRVGTQHAPSTLLPRGDEPPLDGAHGMFFVLGEEIDIVVPQDAGARVRMLAEERAGAGATTRGAVDGSLTTAIIAHEKAEAAHGGIAGLLAEGEVLFRDPEARRIMDACRRALESREE